MATKGNTPTLENRKKPMYSLGNAGNLPASQYLLKLAL